MAQPALEASRNFALNPRHTAAVVVGAYRPPHAAYGSDRPRAFDRPRWREQAFDATALDPPAAGYQMISSISTTEVRRWVEKIRFGLWQLHQGLVIGSFGGLTRPRSPRRAAALTGCDESRGQWRCAGACPPGQRIAAFADRGIVFLRKAHDVAMDSALRPPAPNLSSVAPPCEGRMFRTDMLKQQFSWEHHRHALAHDSRVTFGYRHRRCEAPFIRT